MRKRIEVRIPVAIDCRLKPDVRGARLREGGIVPNAGFVERFVDNEKGEVVFVQLQEDKKNG